jgi:hypothetical protein
MFQASTIAAKARWKQRQLEECQARVDRLSGELTTDIIMTCIPNTDRNIDALSEDVVIMSKRARENGQEIYL